MLINDKRALAYTAKIAWVKPIEGADNIELVGVNCWTCIAKKGEFKTGDTCVYFEIDSKLPVAEWSAFMENKHYKVKTMKLSKFKVISQGLALPVSAFNGIEIPTEENVDMTDKLSVTYSVEEDNKRKSNSEDKYKKMAARRPEIFRTPVAKWFMKREWGRKLMFILFGKKKDKRGSWPQWVKKTDEERCQNMPFLFTNPNRENETWYATEKVDGTSTTFTMKRKKFSKPEYYICSRNVVFDKPDKKCFYDTNVYVEMAEKYNMEQVLQSFLDENSALEYVTLQGETYGGNIQKRNYSIEEHNFVAFNLIFGFKDGFVKRFNPVEMEALLFKKNIPCVPIINTKFVLPATCEELLNIATGDSCLDGKAREGIVFRSEDGTRSFKAVSNEFLMKYHS